MTLYDCNSLMLVITFFFLVSFTSAKITLAIFPATNPNIAVRGDARFGTDVIPLTPQEIGGKWGNSTGRVFYKDPIDIWGPQNTNVVSFTTEFVFAIHGSVTNGSGGGLAFFLSPVGSVIPENSYGGWLGLFNETTNNSSSNQMVAVEFDTFQDSWDLPVDHVGIDVNSIVSNASKTWTDTMTSSDFVYVRIDYDGASKNLSVFLKHEEVPVAFGSLNLTHEIDLSQVLPQQVIMGFSASTGSQIIRHEIFKWNFTSNFIQVRDDVTISNIALGFIIASAILVFFVGLALGVWCRRVKGKEKEEDWGFDEKMDENFMKGTGPRRFSYKELMSATHNFSEDGKLGEGGFGGVYKGVLGEYNDMIAVKRISKGSKQGTKEYVSEVTVISRLRHRNLVQLLGWCHNRGDLLLVYEFMPNGSLDSHLFGATVGLTWEVRYKIACGLASALLYLHEEWEQCVVHRDIKSSNVMLDSNFNAKLGDFGLARLVDHGRASETTVIAGTMGYLAPECIITGKASRESDVFSFGVVTLEIACGRRPVDRKADSLQARLVEWVWDLYGRGRLFDAVDERLGLNYDKDQMERLMVVGLWCAHPDESMRPSIRQAIQVMNFQEPIPDLPSQMPVPTYYAPPRNPSHYSDTTSSHLTISSSASNTISEVSSILPR
ncbi:L-type lectin-domain containing receptor kinase IX.1 [Amborella trichopoda]|uniref:non-specific serine/threonine protein kinase n=1 Tax=Amborella trichopoda TaxID=13333 RepID=U5CXK9_AMBTC|nr:L-type lectin-domain containing receptor kinase IX.1 [Amborella trichopoda]ERN18046.1 hypothetical protein AMTR_s00046p00196610 [Amborella trichopoda]|eukprot:XP_006856579.1 L-type lectin-domain containing receptor kinase IX.1 [Amborella trichopoda]